MQVLKHPDIVTSLDLHHDPRLCMNTKQEFGCISNPYGERYLEGYLLLWILCARPTRKRLEMTINSRFRCNQSTGNHTPWGSAPNVKLAEMSTDAKPATCVDACSNTPSASPHPLARCPKILKPYSSPSIRCSHASSVKNLTPVP